MPQAPEKLAFDKFGIVREYDRILSHGKFDGVEIKRKGKKIYSGLVDWIYLDIGEGNTRISFLPLILIHDAMIYECMSNDRGQIFTKDRASDVVCVVRAAFNPLLLDLNGRVPDSASQYIKESIEILSDAVRNYARRERYEGILEYCERNAPAHQFEDVKRCVMALRRS